MRGPTATAGADARGDIRPDARPETQAAPLLAVADLAAGYGRRAVLRGVTFCLRAGECAALLGPNGGGKTTLLRVLSGVLAPQAGTVHLAGRPLSALRPKDRARLAAVVPQRGPCPEDLTAREMVLLGRYAHLSPLGWYGPEDHTAADRALAATDTESLARRRLRELSGGELQRVLLARALAQESPLLLLDELASGLDLARMTGLFDLLERRRADGACVLMAVHDCNLAALYATRLLGLNNGRLAFDGPVRHVFTEENLSALYQTPVTVLPHPLWGLPQALPARAHGPWAAPETRDDGADGDAALPDASAGQPCGPARPGDDLDGPHNAGGHGDANGHGNHTGPNDRA